MVRKLERGSKLFKLPGDLFACLCVEVIGLFANMERVSKPVRVEISTLKMRFLELSSSNLAIPVSISMITLRGHRATIGLGTAREMGISAADDWSGGVNGTNCIEDQWSLVLCYPYMPAEEDKLSKTFKSLEAKAHPASKKASGSSWIAPRHHCSFTMSSAFCMIVLTSFPMKSDRTPSVVTLRPNAVSNLRNRLPRGTLMVLLYLSATVVLTFEVKYFPFSLGAKLVLDGTR